MFDKKKYNDEEEDVNPTVPTNEATSGFKKYQENLIFPNNTSREVSL